MFNIHIYLYSADEFALIQRNIPVGKLNIEVEAIKAICAQFMRSEHFHILYFIKFLTTTKLRLTRIKNNVHSNERGANALRLCALNVCLVPKQFRTYFAIIIFHHYILQITRNASKLIHIRCSGCSSRGVEWSYKTHKLLGQCCYFNSVRN